jgi:hypothetical protein
MIKLPPMSFSLRAFEYTAVGGKDLNHEDAKEKKVHEGYVRSSLFHLA